MNVIELEQGSPAWLEWRRDKIGASDAPIIMEDSPWTTPYQLWQQKVFRFDVVKTDAMQKGTTNEQEAREAFTDATGIQVFPLVAISQEFPWMIASYDGISGDYEIAVEIKCPGKKDQNEAKEGRIPKKYYAQLQHQIYVKNFQAIHYWSWDIDEKRGVLLTCYRDEKYISEMILKEKAFYDCISSLTAPEMSDKDKKQRSDEEWLTTANLWNALQEEKKILEQKEKELRERFILMCEGKTCQGGGVTVSRSMRQGHIEYTKIPQLKDLDLSIYRKKPTEVWSVRSESN